MNGANTPDKPMSPAQKFLIAVMIIEIVIAAVLGTYALVYAALKVNDGEDVQDDFDDFQQRVSNLSITNNNCFQCDTRTGDVIFNSTLNVAHNRVPTLAQFFERKSEHGLTGLTVPGYAFLNSPMSRSEGAPTFLGDVIQSVGSSFTQQDVDLKPATGPGSRTPNEPYPNPMSFNSRSSKHAVIGLGSFLLSKSPVRGSAKQMSPSPAVYFVIDDTTTPFKIHLCILVSNHPSKAQGAGEHCTSALFETTTFP